ncbi:MAG: Gfo/Idh/MocA family oxidoreductase [Bryobacteraceae bacterium]|nr:Gfo/Idh/MocA family oxidoreductase [Bryobacteraceae bacterium]
MKRRSFLQSMPALAAQGSAAPVRAAVWGTQHSHTAGKLRAMRESPLYQVAAVCETNAAAKARAEKNPAFQGLAWVGEEQLLNDRSLQLIVVECSVWDALPMGRKVIAAGKHLHLEKPPGNAWAPFKALVEEARRKKLLLQTGYVWRCHEGVNAALDAARKGWLGDVLAVRGTMNADRDAEQRAVEAKYKGGGLFELGGHVIDRIVDLLGRPVKVQSWLRHHTKAADNLADNNLAVLEYERSLATVTQIAQMAGAGDHRSLEIIGTDGTVMVWPESNPPRMRVHMRRPQGPYRAGWQEITLGPQPRFVGDFAELGKAITTGQPLRLSYDHELLLHETLLRASGELT